MPKIAILALSNEKGDAPKSTALFLSGKGLRVTALDEVGVAAAVVETTRIVKV